MEIERKRKGEKIKGDRETEIIDLRERQTDKVEREEKRRERKTEREREREREKWTDLTFS